MSDDLWTWAVEAYARTGASSRLVRLQDDHGADVNLTLWTLWRARRARPPMTPDLARAARARIADWVAHATTPLRAVRRSLADPAPGDVASSEIHAAREATKAAEIASERVTLAMLAALDPDISQPTAPTDARMAAETDLATLYAALGWPAPDPSDLTALAGLTDAALPPRIATGAAMRIAPANGNEGANDDALRLRLAALQARHRDLDAAIRSLEASETADLLTIRRFKKEKLAVRDQIAMLEDQLNPDIIA